MRGEAKQWLKRFRAANALNSYFKDVALSIESRAIRRSYATRVARIPANWSESDLRRMLRERMGHSGVRPLSRGKPLHVFCVGTYYDHEAAGFLQCLARLGKVTVYRNADGVYGLNGPAGLPAGAARESHNRCLVEQVRAAHAGHRVDFLIGTMVAQSIGVEALSAVRSAGIPVTNIAMDDRLPVHWRTANGLRLGAIGLAGGVDLTLQTTREYVARYLADRHPAVLWPFGSDPKLFKPAGPKDLDVVFVGNNYGKRHRLVTAIRKAGVAIECYGNGFANGHLPGERVPALFARAKIVLGTGLVGHSSRIVTLKLRDFDGPMSGALYVTTHNPDLAEHYELGSEIVTYRSIRECVDKVRYYLAHDEERERIAAAGRARAVRDHTWDRRMSSAIDLLAAE